MNELTKLTTRNHTIHPESRVAASEASERAGRTARAYDGHGTVRAGGLVDPELEIGGVDFLGEHGFVGAEGEDREAFGEGVGEDLGSECEGEE